MIYEAKEFTVKDGLKIVVKSPEKGEAGAVMAFMDVLLGQTPYFLSSPEDFRKRTVESEAEFIEGSREGTDYFICVYADGKIIGDCGVNFDRHLKGRHRSSLSIGIDKAYWGKGIGNLLMDEMIRLARETEGIEQVELGVINENARAKRLYEKKGFRKTGVLPHALKLPDGTYYDEEMMTLFFERG